MPDLGFLASALIGGVFGMVLIAIALYLWELWHTDKLRKFLALSW